MTFLALKSAHSGDDDDTSSFFSVLSVVHFPILPVCRILCSKKWIFKIKHNWVLFFIHVQISHVWGHYWRGWLSVYCMCYLLICFHSYLVLNSSSWFLHFHLGVFILYSFLIISIVQLYFFMVLVAFPELKIHMYNIILNWSPFSNNAVLPHRQRESP